MHVKDRKNQPIFICDSGKLHQLKYIHSTCFILFGIYILLFGILYHERHNGWGVHGRKFGRGFNIWMVLDFKKCH
jgi:hypothetical protein